MALVDQYCYRTEQLLQLEQAAELQETRCLLGYLPPKLLEKRGICLTKLIIDGRKTSLYGRQVVKFKSSNVNRPELSATTITSGDIVGLHETSSPTCIASGIVVKVSALCVSVAFEHSDELTNVADGCQYYIVKLANDVTYRRLRRAVERLKNAHKGVSSGLVDLAFRESSDDPCNDVSLDSLRYFNLQLDSSQKEAVRLALSQPRLSIIHGPPGTGKSTTIVEVIRQFVSQGLRVLACAPSNVAVDNLVLRLAKSKVRVTRLGHPARAMEEIQSLSLDAKVAASDESSIVEDIRKDIDSALKLRRQGRGPSNSHSTHAELKSLRQELKSRTDEAVRRVLKGSEVILSTLTSATHDGPLKILEEMHFDVVVIDECSQALEIACWIPLLQSPRCVLAGDHLQLPPTILSHKAAADGLSTTLMERLISSHSSHVHMLTVQYRMNRKIMQWASDELYDGRLTASPTVTDHLLRDIPGVEDNDVTCEPLLLIDTAGCDLPELYLPDELSKGNEGEADLVAIHVESLIDSGLKASEIAVISPYNLQVELIRNRLAEKHKDLEVKSVDGYQGREKEAVVISLVRSNTRGAVGFLAEDRRLNVAVTRARRQVTVVCDSDTVSGHPFISRLVKYMSANGVVHTAAEYQQEHTIGQISDKVAKLMKESDSTGATKSTSKKSSNPSKQKSSKASKQAFMKDTDISTPGAPHAVVQQEVRESKEQREQRIRAEFTMTIIDFIKSGASSYSFSASLSSFERLLVHQLAESHGLEHVSVSEGSDRHIVIRKPQELKSAKKLDQLLKDIPDSLKLSETKADVPTADVPTAGVPTADVPTADVPTVVAPTVAVSTADVPTADVPMVTVPTVAVPTVAVSTANVPMDKVPTTDAPTVAVPRGDSEASTEQVACVLCGKSIPKSNLELHRLRCSSSAIVTSTSTSKADTSCRPKSTNQLASSNNPSNQHSGSNKPTQQDAKSSAKPKKKKNKDKKTVNDTQLLGKVDDDDFDGLLAAANQLNFVCNFKKCKTLVKILGTNCQFCRLRFCIGHGMPEVHGCGAAAKTQARITISREGKLYNGSGVPNKKPDATTRANLERKLNKKLTNLTDKRKPKEKH